MRINRPTGIFLAALAPWALFSAPIVNAGSRIVEDGRARAEIVIADKPARAAEFGASELQTYVEKITGCRLDILTAPSGSKPVKIYVGESEAARQAGVTAEGLGRDAFRMLSGTDWLALVGNDVEFVPREPWARHHGQWLEVKEKAWEELAGHPWRNPIASRIYKNYNKHLDIWSYDHRGSLNAVYAFLRELGVRWYMPGELGEIVPKTRDLALPEIDRTVRPAFEVRSVSRPMLCSSDLDDALWYLRIGANDQYGILHHGLRNLTEHPDQRAAHPEYYVQLANGKRDNESETANACLSSEGFFRETVAFARLMFDHYDLPIVSVMPHDGFTHCQCDECRDQVTLDRGASGRSSDYVWSFVVRVANELAKTHPEKKVFCGAYSSYRLPPLTIDKLPDNVLVQITNGRPIRELDDEIHQQTAELREQWLAKTNNPLSLTLNYTPFTNRGAYRPQYWPHVIARGIRASHDEVWREDVWLSSGKGGLHYPGMAHLNPYVISRFWWDPRPGRRCLVGRILPPFLRTRRRGNGRVYRVLRERIRQPRQRRGSDEQSARSFRSGQGRRSGGFGLWAAHRVGGRVPAHASEPGYPDRRAASGGIAGVPRHRHGQGQMARRPRHVDHGRQAGRSLSGRPTTTRAP